MRYLLKRFREDERGNIAMMSAGFLTLAISCAALGVDVGSIFTDRRKAQSTADLAAIVAASNLTNATNAATATLARNNFSANSLVSIELGAYTADSSIAPQNRFVTPAPTPNAARVTLQTRTPLYFARYFVGADGYTIRTAATASSTAAASFAIGSRLAALNGGLLNGILSGLLGTHLSLSTMDYRALASANIDAFDFLPTLATRANLNALTYDAMLNANVKVSDVLAAMLTTQQTTNGASVATTALSGILQSLATATSTLRLGSLIDVGSYGSTAFGQKPKVALSLDLLDLLSATGAAANGAHQIATDADLALPGIASVSLTATIGERPQGSSWVTLGPQGASVHTAQTRVLLSVKLLGSGSVSAVNLPLYVEVAAGTATLNNISCGRPDIATTRVTLGVSPGIIDAWIGNVTASDMTNFSTKPNPPAAPLVSLGLISVSGRAHATMASSAPANIDFSYADVTGQTQKTVNASNFTSSLTASLLGDLALGVSVGPLGIPIPGIGSAVASILGGATASIDSLLTQILGTLGVGVGQANVWVNSVRCDGAVLVN